MVIWQKLTWERERERERERAWNFFMRVEHHFPWGCQFSLLERVYREMKAGKEISERARERERERERISLKS